MANIAGIFIGACLAIGITTSSSAQSTMSAAKWNSDREILKNDASERKSHISICVTDLKSRPDLLETYSIVTNVPNDKVVEIMCARIQRAIINGRYNYAMYEKLKSGIRLPEIIKIIQGR